jgi:predicted anti-sigma-YlaC factor YlaD
VSEDETTNNRTSCPRDEIAAYLDGELDARAGMIFEEHAKDCSACSADLSEQRRLLCALDFALGSDDPGLALPRNFARVVAKRAESDMSGMRQAPERRRAVRLCLGLVLLCFLLLEGASLSASFLLPLRFAARYASSIFGLVWNALYDMGTGVAVVLRAVARHFLFDLHPLNLLVLLLFAVALVLLPRLIINYHRRQITE